MAAFPPQPTSRTRLYRRTLGFVIFNIVAAGWLALPVSAQVGRTAKVNPGPRAVGLLVLQTNGKARLIPITILIDGQYFDAGAYKAAPVPMALWSDTVYEAMRTGVSQGLFTVTGALQQQKNGKDSIEWMGEGSYQTNESLKAKAAKKPQPAEPRDINQDEGPPVLRRSGGDKPKPADTPPAPAAAPPAQQAPVSTSAPPAGASQSTPPAAPAGTSSQPSNAKEEKAPEDNDRPKLMRGQLGAQQAELAQKAAGPSAKADVTATRPSGSVSASHPGTPSEGQIQLIPAISDSHGPDPVPYTYSIKPEEEQQFRKKMLAMAADEVRARVAQLTATGNSAPAPSSSRGKSTAKPVQPAFDDVQLHVLDLAGVNEPELVLTASARMPHPLRKNEGASPDASYAVTLVARQDVNGDFHKALASVTDAAHLDVYPRLEFIDAVDADGDGRGELLFRQVYDSGEAFVVYRAIGDRLYALYQGTPGR